MDGCSSGTGVGPIDCSSGGDCAEEVDGKFNEGVASVLGSEVVSCLTTPSSVNWVSGREVGTEPLIGSASAVMRGVIGDSDPSPASSAHWSISLSSVVVELFLFFIGGSDVSLG